MHRKKVLSEKDKFKAYSKCAKDVLIDMDGTLCEWGYPGFGPPTTGAKEALREMRKRGLRVVIWTSRVDRKLYTEQEVADSVFQIKKWCYTHDIEIDEIDVGDRGKRLGLAYVDDRGVNFSGRWNSVLKQVWARQAEQKKAEQKEAGRVRSGD